MKTAARLLGLLALAFLATTTARAAELGLSFGSPEWTGKSVPRAGICLLHGGKGSSPEIVVSAIPRGARKLVLKFTDRDWQGEGGHGVVGIGVPADAATITVPSFQGETDTLPPGLEKITSHLCSGCAGGIYLGPCSGGRGHQYFVTVQAVDATGTVLAEGKLVLGNY